ncbi:hypothetical protein HY086_06005 [Candidatus Gottesmanbacteria bacterium]|nr:hypothetical protein [Candidatus Gottesmanbacteria bacterium]
MLMITDADIKKLKSVFATKDDLIAMEKRQDQKYATKRDLAEMENRQDQKYATKKDLGTMRGDLVSMEQRIRKDIKGDLVSMEQRIRKDIVDDITGYMQENVIPLLNEHERRLDRLEKRVGGFPAVA